MPQSAPAGRPALPRLAAFAALLLLAACAPAMHPPEQPIPPLPQAPREFRAAWIATVHNIDWPSKPGLPVEQQKKELLAILDSAETLHLNAVVFQIRPAADAFYASKLEPWSEWLTGASGKAPAPAWDPLAFAVKEAHARGLQLHAWFNPFRARDPSVPSMPGDFVREHPEFVKQYGAFWWLDPGEDSVRAHSLAVVADVVKRYDIDGVHIDDYFYPYPITDSAKQKVPFPDSDSYAKYRATGGTLSLGDWRRDNINRFVEGMYDTVKKIKPWVQVGISPFGIWRPGNPAQITGFDAYDEIYADSRKWLESGWVDYFTPQLYWKIDAAGQSFPVLLHWWADNNPRGRHLWPGLYTGRVGGRGRNDWQAQEILDQIRLIRDLPGAGGEIHFPFHTLAQDPDSISALLLEGPYASTALVPATPWIHVPPPPVPHVSFGSGHHGSVEVHARPTGDSAPLWWVERVRRDGAWTVRVLPASLRSWTVEGSGRPEIVAISAAGRLGNESEAVVARW